MEHLTVHPNRTTKNVFIVSSPNSNITLSLKIMTYIELWCNIHDTNNLRHRNLESKCKNIVNSRKFCTNNLRHRNLRSNR